MTGSYEFWWRKLNLAMRNFLGVEKRLYVESGSPEVKSYQPFREATISKKRELHEHK
jgi:hypothetical protein